MFGTYNILLKTIFPNQLFSSNSELPDEKYELYQHIFHIFLIPVFPMGKFWCLRKGHENFLKHDLPEEIYEKISKHGFNYAKTPIYSYAMWILAPLCYFLYNFYTENKTKQEIEISIKENNEDVKRWNKMIDNPTTHDFYQFSTFDLTNEFPNTSSVLYMCKVINYNKDSIQFYKNVKNENHQIPTLINDKKQIFNIFRDKNNLTKIWILKKDLRLSINTNSQNYDYKGKEIESLQTKSTHVLLYAQRINYLVPLEVSVINNLINNSIKATFINLGFEGKIISIENFYPKEKGIYDFPENYIDQNETFSITLSISPNQKSRGQYAIMKCKDKLSDELSVYNISYSGTYATIQYKEDYEK